MINEIRQTVLYILAKDNNGYITPDEFNKYAQTAQIEVFTEYFRLYNLYKNRMKLGRIYSGYADMVKQLEQTIDYFSLNAPITKVVTPAKFTATIVAGVIVSASIADGGAGFVPNTSGSLVIAGPVGSGAIINYTVDSLGNVSTVVVANGGTSYTTVVLSMPNTASTTYNLPSDWYLINAIYSLGFEVKPIAQDKVKNLLRSNLTSPTAEYPNYLMRGNSIAVYPTSISNELELFYVRYPRIPNWTYSTIANGEPIFNVNDPLYQDFEVSASEMYKLVMMICQYCGVQIREPEVVQYAMAQEQLVEQNDNTKT